MKYPLLVLTLLFTANAYSSADLDSTCSLVEPVLQDIDGLEVSTSTEKFYDWYGKKHYEGCVIKADGNRNLVKEDWHPVSLFYPSEGHVFSNQNWAPSNEGDGPDGSSFTITKENIFCNVAGIWDGGDDSDPSYQPLPEFELIVECARKL